MSAPSVSRLDLVTTWGVIRLAARSGALLRCDLPVRQTARTAPRITRCRLSARTPADRRALARAGKFVRACLAGKETPAAPALQPEVSGAFTARLLAALQGIPRGATVTYGELARRLGRPGAARAVGNACGANPLPLFIPCHRVVAAGGAPGGFSAGRAWKKFLLTSEGAG
jgi:methylated-DNA-[protein]-cysteine S-methyltransferase